MAAAVALQAISSALVMQAFGTYVVLLGAEYGWSRAALSGAFSVMRIEEGLLGPIEGWLLDRFGPRAIMRVGVLTFAAGMFLLSRIDSLIDFYLAFLVIAIGVSLAGFLALTTAVVQWFDRKRSLAMGIAMLGGASGGLMLPFVVSALETYGWRSVSAASAVIVLVVGLPLVQVIRNQPVRYGLYPDGIAPEPPRALAEGEAPPPPRIEFTVRAALHTRAFWLISLAHAASVLVVSVVTVHLTPHAVALGYSLQQAALVITVQTVANLIARPLGGLISDRVGSRSVIFVSMLMHAVALGLLARAETAWMLWAFAVLNGVAWGARVPVIVSMRAEYFGARSFGTIMGISTMVVTVAAVAAPVLAGWSFDVLGSYTLSFTILAVLAGVGSLFVVFLPPPRPSVETEDVPVRLAV
ncbi:MAG: MFS transporter [Chloroflexi bacterium]|nr:MFS transporter [Chloroflexota bacterium]